MIEWLRRRFEPERFCHICGSELRPLVWRWHRCPGDPDDYDDV